MNCKDITRKTFISFSIAFSILFLTNSAWALVEIQPSSQDFSAHSDLIATIDLGISGVNDVYGFQYDLSYNPNYLSITSMKNISEGTFINESGTVATFCVDVDISTPGIINDFACSRRKATGGVNGNGILSNVTFEINPISTFPAISALTLYDVKISDIDSQSLDNSSANGVIRIYECLFGQDINTTCTFGTCTGNSTCNSSNQWGACSVEIEPETCNGFDDNCDGYIDNGPGRIIDYTLNRSCSVAHVGICATGIEICSPTGYSGCPESQNEVCDNFVDEDCEGTDILCAGDVTNSTATPGGVVDRCVDLFDLVIIGTNFGLTSGYDPRADIIVSGEIDIFDLVVVGKEFENGHCCGLTGSALATCLGETY